MVMTRVKRMRRVRTVMIYIGLVVLPGLVAVALLTAGGGGHGTTSSLAANLHPFARLFLAIAAIVLACKAMGVLVGCFGQPPVVGEIAAGIMLGPSVMGSAFPATQQWLISDTTLNQLQVLAHLGVVLFVFLAGLELDVKHLRGNGQLALVVSHVSIAVPFLMGVLLAVVAYRRFAPTGVGFVPFALFLGVALSVTALPVLARILLDLGMYHSEIGTLAMTCALVGDVTAWVLLALVTAVASASSLFGVLATVMLTAVFAISLRIARPLLSRLMTVDDEPVRRLIVPMVLVGVLLAAACTEWIGVHAIFGALLFGLALAGNNAVVERVKSTISGLTTTLLLPLFFAISGFGTDLRLLVTDGGLWFWGGLVLAVSMLGKLGGSALGARIMGTTPNTAWQVGALMNCCGLTELVVLGVGRQLGILSPALFAILVMMTLVSTAFTGPLVKLFQRNEMIVTHHELEAVRSADRLR